MTAERMKENRGIAYRILLTTALFTICIAGLKAASVIVLPFILSIFFAVILSRPVGWLKRHGVPGPLALLIVLVGLLIFLGAVGGLVGGSISHFLAQSDTYQVQLGAKVEKVKESLPDYFLPDRTVDMGAAGLKFFKRLLQELGNLFTDIFILVLTVLFMLAEAGNLPAKLRAILGRNTADIAPFQEFTTNLQRYLVIKSLVSLMTGAAVSLWVWLLGVDLPLLWGLIAFLLNFVPNVGSIIAAVPAMLLAFIQHDLLTVIGVGAGYTAVNLLVGYLVEPRMMGKGLGLSPLVVFLSLLFWGWVFGPMGMVISVPLTMTLKIASNCTEESRWLAVLLGRGTGLEEEEGAGDAGSEPAATGGPPPGP